ncbi:MAG: NHL repeat-containing protein [Planctomycetes bacterium]|nr:NHL repeat-containing protein [Planctomycetota bacterium]MBI3844049.1 NHL repeat-containing protein [Planctomycetota bacterium]
MIRTSCSIFPTLLVAFASAATPKSEMRFGHYEREIAGLAEPEGVAIAADGTIVVAESGRDRVSIFAADGSPIRSWGSRGSGPGQLLEPRGVAIAPDGEIFVVDSGNDRVQVFSMAGEHRHDWGNRGRGPGQFADPVGIAVDASRVVVVDRGNRRVQVFDRAGKFVASIASDDDDADGMRRPEGVALGTQGRIVVTDSDADRVHVFDASGKPIARFGASGPYPGMLGAPLGLACRDGRVYVADSQNHRVQVFDESGSVVYQWGVHTIQPHEGAGHLHYPNALALDESGRVAVVVESFENRCQIFSAVPKDSIPPLDEAALFGGEPLTHFGATLSLGGDLLAIPEPESHALQLFDFSRSDPILITTIGNRGRKFGEFVRPSAVLLDPLHSLLYAIDAGNRRLQQFRLDRREPGELKFRPSMSCLVRSLDLRAVQKSASLEWTPDPCAIARDSAGNVWLVDERNSILIAVSSKLEFVRAIGDASSLPHPTDVAWSRAGDLAFVVDATRRCVQAFDSNGKPSFAFGGDLVEPFGIVAGRDGFVYVTDAGADRVLKFDERGQLVTMWGREGMGAGEFFKPKGIDQDEKGRIVVIDSGNHRGQVFGADGKFIDAFGSRLYVKAAKKSREKKE